MASSSAKGINRSPNLTNAAVVLNGNAAAQLSVSAVAAQTAAITAGGIYDVWANVDVYVKVNEVANDVTASTGYLIRAGTTVPVFVGDNEKIGAIAGSAGTLNYHRVN